MTEAPSPEDLFAALPRQGWRVQAHGWMPGADELGRRAGGLVVRRAARVPCYNVFINGEMVRGKHGTPQAAMGAAERLAAQLAQEARASRSRGRSSPSSGQATPDPLKPTGAAPMSLDARLIATVPGATAKDIYIGTAGPAELAEGLEAIAQASGQAFMWGTLLIGHADRMAASPDPPADEIAMFRRRGAAMVQRADELAYPLILTAQRAQAAGLDWKAIIRDGAAKGAEGIPDGLVLPDAGQTLAEYVMVALEAIIRQEAGVRAAG